MNLHSAPAPGSLAHLRAADRHGLTFLAIAVSSTALAIWLSAHGGWMRWTIGQVMLGASLVQWFAVLHECGHRTMFRSRSLNVIAGTVAGFLTLVPFSTWTRVHTRHHKWTGWQDLDPTTQALVPRRLGWIERTLVDVCWRLWIPLFSVVYRIENYWNIGRLARMFPRPDERRAVRRSVVLHVLGYVVLVAAVGPWELVRLAAAGIVVSLIVEDLLLLSQHTHVPQQLSRGHGVRPVPALEQDVFTRSLRLPVWASTLLLHFDAHELHHMYPFVPGYHLRRIPYRPEHEVGWWEWVRMSKRMRGVVLLFQNRDDTGIRI